MKVLIVFVALISNSSFAFKKSGGGVSGGGNGFLSYDGKVSFADFISPKKNYKRIKSKDEKKKILNKYFFSKNRYVSKLFYPAPHFFSCAKDILLQSESKILQDLALELELMNPFLTEFNFKFSINGKNMHNEQLEFPYYATHYNSNINKHNQVSLAYYNYGSLFIQKRLYEQLSEEEKCGLSLHESFRILSGFYIKIDDDMIILLTRYYMKKIESHNELSKVKRFKDFFLSHKVYYKLRYYRKRRVSFEHALWAASVGSPALNENGRYYDFVQNVFSWQPDYEKVYNIVQNQNEELQCFNFDVLKQEFVDRK